MKFTLIALILFYTSSLAAQDNVKISYESPEGRDRIINELNDVKILEIISNDKEALDKKFTLQIVRYQEGKPDTVYS